MSASAVPASPDPIRSSATSVRISVDGKEYSGVNGQTIAAILIASGTLSWRATSSQSRPRGMFCGIGVCFDCIAEVNGLRDVRLCQREAVDGDIIQTQHDLLPTPAADSRPNLPEEDC